MVKLRCGESSTIGFGSRRSPSKLHRNGYICIYIPIYKVYMNILLSIIINTYGSIYNYRVELMKKFRYEKSFLFLCCFIVAVAFCCCCFRCCCCCVAPPVHIDVRRKCSIWSWKIIKKKNINIKKSINRSVDSMETWWEADSRSHIPKTLTGRIQRCDSFAVV